MYRSTSLCQTCLSLQCTGQPRYVKLAYLKYTAYVEVLIYSRAFPLDIALYFKPVYVELGYHEISAISKSKISFPLLYHYLHVKVNFVLVKKLHKMNVKQSNKPSDIEQ